MNRRRRSFRSLTDTRIYPKKLRFYLFSAEAIENPKTGKISKWHSLCLISEGEEKARAIAKAIMKHNGEGMASGDMPGHVERYRLHLLQRREKDRPREPARVKLFDAANKEISRVCGVIKDAFTDFDADQVLPVDVARFVDQWEGQRMAQVYLSRLSDFFAWACRKGIRHDNPCSEISVEKPPARDRYITHAEFHEIRDALMIGEDGRETPSGPMVQCYVDLCYLLYQRTTEIRLLKWSQIFDGLIHFKPTKTERSSGATVDVPVTPAIQAALDRARALGAVKSVYVIHTHRGQPYTTRGLGSAWVRATKRAKVADATLKDLRAKALTDAKAAGYELKQLAVAAAHTDEETTDGYIKRRETPRSEVEMVLPPKPKY